jgi:hypothetical protein
MTRSILVSMALNAFVRACVEDDRRARIGRARQARMHPAAAIRPAANGLSAKAPAGAFRLARSYVILDE